MNSAPLSEQSNTPVIKSTPPANTSIATVIFEVPRPPAIVPCNNEEVRVTVGLIDLQPMYDYVTVPKRSLSAFLKARVKNSSNFYILPGQTNIYSDNTFIGKVSCNNNFIIFKCKNFSSCQNYHVMVNKRSRKRANEN